MKVHNSRTSSEVFFGFNKHQLWTHLDNALTLTIRIIDFKDKLSRKSFIQAFLKIQNVPQIYKINAIPIVTLPKSETSRVMTFSEAIWQPAN